MTKPTCISGNMAKVDEFCNANGISNTACTAVKSKIQSQCVSKQRVSVIKCLTYFDCLNILLKECINELARFRKCLCWESYGNFEYCISHDGVIPNEVKAVTDSKELDVLSKKCIELKLEKIISKILSEVSNKKIVNSLKPVLSLY